jgi:hypothetical protein
MLNTCVLVDGNCMRGGFNDASNKRLERTRHERPSLVSNLGEPLKRSVQRLPYY